MVTTSLIKPFEMSCGLEEKFFKYCSPDAVLEEKFFKYRIR